MTEQGKVFLLDEDKTFLEMYEHFLSSKGYKIFTTDNPYKLLLYGREITPDIILLEDNLPSRNNWEYLHQLKNEVWAQDTPVVLLSTTLPKDSLPKSIAHILPRRMSLQKVIDLIESYCVGNKEHDFFILSDYTPKLEEELAQSGIERSRVFVVHNLDSSKKYLSKNHPQKVLVKCTKEEFEKIKKELPATEVLRIDSFAEVSNSDNPS